MLPEPNFPVRPEEFVGRRPQIDEFRRALQHGLSAGRTASFAVLGDWGMGKSSLLLKCAALCSDPSYCMLPVVVSASKDIHDYLRLVEILLDKFAQALRSTPSTRSRVWAELDDCSGRRLGPSALGLTREARPYFLSSGSSLLSRTLGEAWEHILRPAQIKGAIFFLDDLQNIVAIGKADLALMLRDQFQAFGIEGMNYSVCFSAQGDFFGEIREFAEPASRFYTKLYLTPFTPEATSEYVNSVFPSTSNDLNPLAAWLYEKTLGHPYFLAFLCRQLSMVEQGFQPGDFEHLWPSIFEQLSREKFRSDISQLSRKEFELLRRAAQLEQEGFAAHELEAQFQREYFRRLTEAGLLIRVARGRYKLYHPLFRAFLEEAK
jgi:hypothetical protein